MSIGAEPVSWSAPARAAVRHLAIDRRTTNVETQRPTGTCDTLVRNLDADEPREPREMDEAAEHAGSGTDR
jgi:hypothetical protein